MLSSHKLTSGHHAGWHRSHKVVWFLYLQHMPRMSIAHLKCSMAICGWWLSYWECRGKVLPEHIWSGGQWQKSGWIVPVSWRQAITLTLQHSACPSEFFGWASLQISRTHLYIFPLMFFSCWPLPPFNQLPKTHRERTEWELGYIWSLAEIQPRIVSI